MHILLIPDGVRRHSKTYNFQKEKSYQIGACKIVEFIEKTFTNWSEVNEFSIFPLAEYNLSRSIEDVSCLRLGFRSLIEFLKQKKIYADISLIGNESSLEGLCSETLSHLNMLIEESKKKNYKKKLNLLLAYDSLYSCPKNIDARNWKPFQTNIDVIYRYAQPNNWTRGSAIFPMSEQAYWGSTSVFFPSADWYDFYNDIQNVIPFIKKKI